ELAADYREQAKDVMRDMDADIEPLRERAEQLARQHLKKRGLDGETEDAPSDDDARDADAPTSAPSGDAPARVACAECDTSNEPDAAFCKKCGASLRAEATTDAS